MANRRKTENGGNSTSPASRVVFLGGLFTEVERAVPSPPEKQNDFAVRFQFARVSNPRLRPLPNRSMPSGLH